MIVIEKQGTLYVTVRCTGGGNCGLGKMLDMSNTQGNPSEEVIARLVHSGEYHEQRHPKHQVEVTIYRNAQLPIPRSV